MSVTAREIDTNLKSGKYKKALVCDDITIYPWPVLPITASTYKTGKHGHAKTRFLLKDYFTNLTFNIIVDSDQKFTFIEQSLNYAVGTGIVMSHEGGQCEILTSTYQTVIIPYDKPLHQKEVVYESYSYDGETRYRLKI